MVVPSCVTTNEEELARRRADPGRVLRLAEQEKRRRYGNRVMGMAIADTGRLGAGTKQFLRSLLKQEEEGSGVTYNKLVAELQAVVLGGTAHMLQKARGELATG